MVQHYSWPTPTSDIPSLKAWNVHEDLLIHIIAVPAGVVGRK